MGKNSKLLGSTSFLKWLFIQIHLIGVEFETRLWCVFAGLR